MPLFIFMLLWSLQVGSATINSQRKHFPDENWHILQFSLTQNCSDNFWLRFCKTLSMCCRGGQCVNFELYVADEWFKKGCWAGALWCAWWHLWCVTVMVEQTLGEDRGFRAWHCWVSLRISCTFSLTPPFRWAHLHQYKITIFPSCNFFSQKVYLAWMRIRGFKQCTPHAIKINKCSENIRSYMVICYPTT